MHLANWWNSRLNSGHVGAFIRRAFVEGLRLDYVSTVVKLFRNFKGFSVECCRGGDIVHLGKIIKISAKISSSQKLKRAVV